MENLETQVLKRIQNIDLNMLNNIIDKLAMYGIIFYNNYGEFEFNKFKNDCYKTHKLLYKNNKPDPDIGIKYQLCDFMSAIQSIVGIRNLAEFMGKKLKYTIYIERRF